MGLHLYVPDEEDRGTNWSCTVDEMLQYAAAAEPQQVLTPLFPFSAFFPNPWDSGFKSLLAWR